MPGGGRPFLLKAAIIGTLQMLAGAPETIIFTWIIIGGSWLVDGTTRAQSGGAGRNFELTCSGRRLVLLVIVVALLSAVQLLPFLDLAIHSQRETGYATGRWSMPGWGTINFLVPMIFGFRESGEVFFPYFQNWTSSYYLGALLPPLFFWAILSLRTAREQLLMLVAALGLLLAFGENTPMQPFLKKLLPLLTLTTYRSKMCAWRFSRHRCLPPW